MKVRLVLIVMFITSYTLILCTSATAQTLLIPNFGGSNVYQVTSNGVANQFLGGLNQPFGLAFDASGNLYISEPGANMILKRSPSGIVSTFVSGILGPGELAFNQNGDLFVTSAGYGEIDEMAPNGDVTSFATGLSYPYGLAFDIHGNLFVSNYANNTIDEITSSGVVSTFSTYSGLDQPTGLAFNNKGFLFVANYGGPTFTNAGQIFEFNSSGNIIELYATVPAVVGITFGENGYLYADTTNGTIINIPPGGGAGSLFANTGPNDLGSGIVFQPSGIQVPEPGIFTLMASIALTSTILVFRRRVVAQHRYSLYP